MINTFEFYGTFYFYSFVCCLAVAWGAYSIPENRGLSLVKVEEHYEAINASKKASTASKPDENNLDPLLVAKHEVKTDLSQREKLV